MDNDQSEHDMIYENDNDDLCLEGDGNIVSCNGNGAIICEVNLNKDTHVCLKKAFLTSVSLNSSTELQVSQQVSKIQPTVLYIDWKKYTALIHP